MTGKRPFHKAFVVEDRGEDTGSFWTICGSACPHGDGRGWNIQIAPGLAVSGRLILREYDEDEKAAEQQRFSKRKK